MDKVYAAIDLKSFYSSVECRERRLDPLTTFLVVADESRTEKTICLAVSPALRAYGIPARARLFEVIEKVRDLNFTRQRSAPYRKFQGNATDSIQLSAHPEFALDFIIAPPRMKLYLDYSQKIYDIYLNHVAPDDIFAYSIDEIFCDISSYLPRQKISPREFVSKMVLEVFQTTGITATAGIAPNLYLAKVAMDILAKHAAPDSNNTRIAELDEKSYRQKLWQHQPLTDFWRIGPGISRRLRDRSIFTMGDIARCSLSAENVLYSLLGVNAELLIDHAWGVEPVTISDIKNYRPDVRSINNSQVLSQPYPLKKAEIIIREMADNLALELTRKQYRTDHLVLYIGYDHNNTPRLLDSDPEEKLEQIQKDPTTFGFRLDHYGRLIPKPARGTLRFATPTNSSTLVRNGFLKLFHRLANPNFTIRRLALSAGNLISESDLAHIAATQKIETPQFTQTDLFHDYEKVEQEKADELATIHAEENLQNAILKIQDRYGKNAILRGTDFEAGATNRERNNQIGGHKK